MTYKDELVYRIFGLRYQNDLGFFLSEKNQIPDFRKIYNGSVKRKIRTQNKT
ncbi:hypothetical protein LEP1GSC193_1311 [Leptospira alstonii serovar Pingchang str. 80-412]|uniref:Uncharacterized protein n=2 Tax=Leptospira alstonii TaxID=28452 RepID=M6CH00_9LEPT|nr:hypothetical protein LEP1GSC194_1458 [Leptospira alstonii serovar Sichuan str. 79601]EQA78590.1 hypothetical protein LEP1GSC193_1311 [Leptospira alstonii serovar Pingchang str. 80-412]